MSCLLRFSYIREASTSTVAYTIFGSVNIVLAIFTVIGNSLILHALRKCPSLFAPTKALLCSLALSDLGVGLIVLPLFAAYCFAVAFNNTELFCNIQNPYAITAYCLVSVSFLTMTAVTLDRFCALKLRQRYRSEVTLKRVVLVLAACWIFGLAWPFIWLLNEKIALIIAMIIIFCCVVISSLLFIRTYYGIRHHQQQIQSQQAISVPRQPGGNQFNIGGYKTFLNTMVLVFCLLLACYLPYFSVLGVTMGTASTSDTTLAFNITAGIIYLNSLLNPIVYCWRMRQIRREILIALPCFAS